MHRALGNKAVNNPKIIKNYNSLRERSRLVKKSHLTDTREIKGPRLHEGRNKRVYIPREFIIFGLPSLEFRVQIYPALRGLILTSPRRESNQKWSQPGKIPGKPTRGKQKYSGERDSLPRSRKSPIDKVLLNLSLQF